MGELQISYSVLRYPLLRIIHAFRRFSACVPEAAPPCLTYSPLPSLLPSHQLVRYRDEVGALTRLQLELQARQPDAQRVLEAAVQREQAVQEERNKKVWGARRAGRRVYCMSVLGVNWLFGRNYFIWWLL